MLFGAGASPARAVTQPDRAACACTPSRVAGVPAIHVEEALWTCAEALGGRRETCTLAEVPVVARRHRVSPRVARPPDDRRSTSTSAPPARALRGQIAALERQLCDALVTAFPHDARAAPSCSGPAAPARGAPRLLTLGELEALRDELAERLREARARAERGRAERQERARVLLERMLLEPRQLRFVRVPRADLGEGGCGVWQVRAAPRAHRDADGLVAGQALLRLPVSHLTA